MDREIKAAFVAVFGLAFTLIFAVLAFRVIVPAILEAHFDGSSLVASFAGVLLALAVAAFTVFWVRLVGRLLRDPEEPATTEGTDHVG